MKLHLSPEFEAAILEVVAKAGIVPTIPTAGGEWMQAEGASVLPCADCGRVTVCRVTCQKPTRATEWRCCRCSVGHFVV